MARPKIEITEEMLQRAEELSASGLNKLQIAEALGISYDTLNRNSASFTDVIKKGRATLAEKVGRQLISNMESGDTTAMIFMAKKLNLFEGGHLEAKTPADAKQGLEELTKIYTAQAKGEITAERADKMASLLDKVLKGIEVNDLEERIKALEEGN